jgi:hypothetical protein
MEVVPANSVEMELENQLEGLELLPGEAIASVALAAGAVRFHYLAVEGCAAKKGAAKKGAAEISVAMESASPPLHCRLNLKDPC